MTTQVLRPSGLRQWTGAEVTTGAGGDPSVATSDNSDATYVTFGVGGLMAWDMTNYTLPAGAVTKTATIRARTLQLGGAPADYGVDCNTDLLPLGGVPDTIWSRVLSAPSAGIATQSTEAVAVDFPQAQVTRIDVKIRNTAATSMRVYEVYLDLVVAEIPVAAITYPTPGLLITDTGSPAVQWNHTAGSDGGPQTQYEVRVFSAAQFGIVGFDPATSPATFETGQVISSSPSAAVGPLSNAVTYRVYVRTAQTINGAAQWSSWDSEEFTTDFATPTISSITAIGDDTNARLTVTVVRPQTFAEIAADADCVLALDAGQYSGSGNWQNQSAHGAALDAIPGAATAAPTYRTFGTKRYARTPGIAAHNITTPDAAALDVTGDLEIVLRVTPDTVTAGDLLYKTSAYAVYLNGSALTMTVWVGGALKTASGTAHGLVAGTTYWLKYTRNAATGLMSFYKAADSPIEPTAWTAIGTATPATGAGAIDNSSGVLTLASSALVGAVPLSIHRVLIRSGIGGATVADFDPQQYTNGATVTSGGAVYTLNGARTYIIDRDAFEYDGTNDYHEIDADPFGAYVNLVGLSGHHVTTPDVAALDITGDLDLRIRVRFVGSVPVNGDLIGKAGMWFLYMSGSTLTGLVIVGGVAQVISFAPGLVADTTYWLRLTRVSATGLLELFKAADSDTEPGAWTSLGTQAATAGAASTNNNALYLGGALLSGNAAAIRVYAATVRSAGALVSDWRAYNFPLGAVAGDTMEENLSSPNGLVWTLVGSGANLVNGNPLNFRTTESFTVLWIGKIASYDATRTYVGKHNLTSSNSAGYTVRAGAAQAIYDLGDGAAVHQVLIANGTVQRNRITGLIRTVSADQVKFVRDNAVVSASTVTDTTTKPIANRLPFAIGRYFTDETGAAGSGSGGGGFAQGLISHVLVYRRALSDAELANLATQLAGDSYYGQRPEWETLTVERSTDAGATWEFVRGYTDRDVSDDGATITLHDYEVPNSDEVRYRARSTGGVFASDYATSADDSWTSIDDWMKDLTDPTLNRRIRVETQPTISRPRRAGILEPIGREDPVVVSTVRQSGRGVLRVITLSDADTYATADQLEALCEADVVLVQTPPTDRWGSRYIAPLELTEGRFNPARDEPERLWEIPFVIAGRPVDDSPAAEA